MRLLQGVAPGLLLTLLAAGAPAATPAATYSVGVEDLDYLPAYGVRDGEYAGAARELLDAFASDQGIRFEYRPLPVPRLYATFFQGLVDFKFPDNPNWQRDRREGKALSYSAPMIEYIDGSLTLPASEGGGIETVHSLGTVIGFTPWAWLGRIEKGKVMLHENADFTALVRQVLKGRLDAAYANVAVVNYQLDRVLQRPGALVFDRALPFSRDHYHLATLTHPDLIEAFDRWLESNREFVGELKARHGVEKGIGN